MRSDDERPPRDPALRPAARCRLRGSGSGSATWPKPSWSRVRRTRTQGRATLEAEERRHPRDLPGTTVYITDLDPDVLRVRLGRTLRTSADHLLVEVGRELFVGVEDGARHPIPSGPPDLTELDRGPETEDAPLAQARPDRRRSTALPTIAPDPSPGTGRSRFDAEAGTVLYNESHPDYLLVKDDETALLDYLAVLVAKEYVVFNNPRASGDEVTEEMVRILVRLLRHLPGRR